MRSATITGILTSLALMGLVFGCGSNGPGGPPFAKVRTFNAYIPASGAAPTLTFTSGTTTLGNAVGFSQFGNSGNYTTVPSGSFTATATGPGAPTPLQFTSSQSLESNNTTYTLIAAGEAGRSGALAPQLMVVQDNLGQFLNAPAQDAVIRVLNLSANPNPIGLYSTSNGVPTTPVKSDVVNSDFGNIAYGVSTSTVILSVPVSQLTNLAIVDATQANPKTVLANVPAFPGQPLRAFTLYVTGQPGNQAEPMTATWVQDYPPTS